MKSRFMLGIASGAVLLLTAASCQSSGRDGLANSNEYVVVGSGGGNETGQVTTYALNRVTGELTQLDRRPVGGALVSFLALNPRLPVMYVSDPRGRQIHWMTIDPHTGMLSPDESQTQSGGTGGPEHLTVDATGSVLIGVNFGAGTADIFPLDPSTGAIGAPSATLSTGRNPHFAEFSPSNGHVYLGSQVDHHVSQYAFSDGVLTALTPERIPQLAPRQLEFHPNGQYAYSVSGPTDNVATYRVAPDGTLTAIDSVRRMPADYDGNLNATGGAINITPSGRFAYVNNRGSNTISSYSIAPDGLLTLLGHESTRGSTPRHGDMDPDGELLVVGNQDSQSIAVFRIDRSTGALSHLNTVEIGVSPYYIGIWRLPIP